MRQQFFIGVVGCIVLSAVNVIHVILMLWLIDVPGVPSCSGADVKEAEVICVSTGTKCINGEYMSDRGLALNDCHAEIVARRSLIRYLYCQLEHFLR